MEGERETEGGERRERRRGKGIKMERSETVAEGGEGEEREGGEGEEREGGEGWEGLRGRTHK